MGGVGTINILLMKPIKNATLHLKDTEDLNLIFYNYKHMATIYICITLNQ
jgi:hypothetical protein